MKEEVRLEIASDRNLSVLLDGLSQIIDFEPISLFETAKSLVNIDVAR